MCKYFVSPQSLVREIWNTPDLVLFIFAGSAAEFALNKAVDWLYFTGKLPGDPLGRMFSTIEYAAKIIFSEEEAALTAIRKIAAIHKNVEQQRAAAIPDWAYRDVLYMLIYYTIAAAELTGLKMNQLEKEDVYDVFYRMGSNMGLTNLPVTYTKWLVDRDSHLNRDLVKSSFSADLFNKYKKHLGAFRYNIMVEVQLKLLPIAVVSKLPLHSMLFYRFLLNAYLNWRTVNWVRGVRLYLIPKPYREKLKSLQGMGLSPKLSQ